MVHNGKHAPEGVRDRRHGRAQAGRVCADADLPRPRRQGARSEAVAVEQSRLPSVDSDRSTIMAIQRNSSIRSDQRPQGAPAGGPDSRQACRRGARHPEVSAAARCAAAGKGAARAPWATPKIAEQPGSVESSLVVVDARVDGGPMFKRIQPARPRHGVTSSRSGWRTSRFRSNRRVASR